jgi:hypothetical protein
MEPVRRRRAEERTAREAARESAGSRGRPANALLEKVLVNLRVLSQVQEGDRLGFTADGFFLLQRPATRATALWTTVARLLSRTSRWETLARVSELIGAAQMFREREDRERVHAAVSAAVGGIEALQRTYSGDALLVQNLEVLLDRTRRSFAGN